MKADIYRKKTCETGGIPLLPNVRIRTGIVLYINAAVKINNIPFFVSLFIGLSI